jgi:hypothetical protein
MNKMYLISVILFVMVLLIGFSNELRELDGYRFVLGLSAFNFLIQSIIKNDIKK